ncbi:arginine-hydroxylase NDUFAF5, mitochondrial [Sipha flava]|jgi:NADH dehydrogenase [ubiquinone] 1 alpha subcomplex assembly factor 5|uniref:Arginine-hydroxylase NDUFAF5, mitochondrial n=1 Tax=Sipha flava TaxID=143950 RepID=A0A2S2QTI2_9HEMI|nr:arginine-hydroxylase NDUFAF5, mitochondrial [Sipha flava]
MNILKKSAINKNIKLSIRKLNSLKNANEPSSMTVFDRKAKIIQKQRAAIAEDSSVYDYIKDEIGYRLSDRLFDIKRQFNLVVDLGCGYGHVSKHISIDNVKELIMCDVSQEILDKSQNPEPDVKVSKIVVDEEKLPFDNDSIDLLISCLNLHWVNNLPSTFLQIKNCLKNDGVFLGAMFAGDTLYELRSSLQLAGIERDGGVTPRISPFVRLRDVGALMQSAGFSMLTLDTDELIIRYPSMFELMWDLKGMGENNAALKRPLRLNKDTMFSAATLYNKLYGNQDKDNNTQGIPATFQILYMIGWKPDPSQPKPLPRGSGQISIKDIGKLDKIVKNMGKIEY